MDRTFLATAIAGGTWVAVCAYLYFAWPSLAVLIEVLTPAPAPLHRVPRAAFLTLGVLAPTALRLKDRWMRASLALCVDALVAAPPLAAIGFFFYPFFVPAE